VANKIKRASAPSTPAILSLDDAARALRVSRVTLWRMEQDGRLPPRDFTLGYKAIGWYRETLDAALRGRNAAA
jgi:predicted DNA-binding transcriptional regulator AlpA